jgi:hypothetical protein
MSRPHSLGKPIEWKRSPSSNEGIWAFDQPQSEYRTLPEFYQFMQPGYWSRMQQIRSIPQIFPFCDYPGLISSSDINCGY